MDDSIDEVNDKIRRGFERDYGTIYISTRPNSSLPSQLNSTRRCCSRTAAASASAPLEGTDTLLVPMEPVVSR